MRKQYFNILPSESGEVAILLYGDIGEYCRVDSARVVAELLQLATTYKKIDVRINSNGGDVFSGMAIYNALRTSKADITIYIDGVAASIAGVIALCGKPLYMSPYAKMMLHNVSGSAWGTAEELRKTATMIETLEADLAEMIAGRCAMTPKEVKERYFNGQDNWLNATQAVELKLADGIYELDDVPVDEPLSTEEEVYKYFNNRLTIEPQNTNSMSLITQIQAIKGFSNKTTDEAVVAGIQQLSHDMEGLQQENENLKKELSELHQREMKNFLDAAIHEGKITTEQRATYEDLMASNREATMKLINELKAPTKGLRADQYINQHTGAEDDLKRSWDELDKAGILPALKASNYEVFKAKFKERFGTDYKE